MALFKRLTVITVALLASTFLLTAAAAQKGADAGQGGPTHAVCVLTPTQKSDGKVHGTVKFTQTSTGVEIEGTIEGLTPGKHGFHVHEFGDLSSPDGMATGGHFDIAKHKHGAPEDADRHSGDLGNITADDSGKATIKVTDKGIALHGANSVLGRALIVHAKADDLKTQPSGDAGGRIAQGVIGVAK
jgi:Cu-Zn family superoxide dismutase